MPSPSRLPCGILFFLTAAVLLAATAPSALSLAPDRRSTRVTDPGMHARKGPRSYPYRAKAQYILEELDLRPGDVVLDIGAGDGWWTERFASAVGPRGIVYAAEVDEKKVRRLCDRFEECPQVRPYLCKTDSVELAERACDLAFLSQTYHHLDLDRRSEYLRHLRRVVRPDGRLAVIEKYSVLADRNRRHGTNISVLVREAEEAGWILVRSELMVGTYHYLTIFVQQDLFPGERARRRGGRGRIRL